MRFILFLITAALAFGCSAKSPTRSNRAVQFAVWAEPKAHCTAFTTATDDKSADTALCEIHDTNVWCVAPTSDAPSCKPYGAAHPQPAPEQAPTGTGSGSVSGGK